MGRGVWLGRGVSGSTGGPIQGLTPCDFIFICLQDSHSSEAAVYLPATIMSLFRYKNH